MEVSVEDIDSNTGNELSKPLSQGKSMASANMQNLGYTPIPQNYMEKNMKSQVQWINHFAFSFQIKNFP